MNPNHLIIAYLPQNPRQPLKEIGEFRLDPALGVLVHRRQCYDPESKQEMAEMIEAQRHVGRSKRYQGQRIAVAPVSYFIARDEELTESRAEAARIATENRAEAIRLAERKDEADDEADETDGDTEETTDSQGQEPDVLPPYAEWPMAELKAEVENRGLTPPTGNAVRTKAAWITVLEDDDEADEMGD